MSILNLEEHQRCYSYEKEQSRSIEVKKIIEGEIWNSKTLESRLIFITKGALQIKAKNKEETRIVAGAFTFVVSNEVLKVCPIADSEIIVFKVSEKKQLCPSYPIESLKKHIPQNLSLDYHLQSLQFNNIVKIYLDQLVLCLNEGLKCNYYYGLKLNELFLLLRTFHSKEQLVLLFSSLLTADMSFSDLVIQNHSKHHTLNDLAQSMNYSTSGFEKKFKKVFGVSGYKWMKEQKAHRVFEAISMGEKNFKELSIDLGFSSESYFYDFCKNEIGLTPGQIRKKSKSTD